MNKKQADSTDLQAENIKRRRVLLGVSAGVACYKSVELARLLMKNNWIVQVVLTPEAAQMINPVLFQAITHEPVWCDATDNRASNAMPHIHLARDVDVVVITPATANVIAKLAHGVSDNLLLTIALARKTPLLVAPSMNLQMWYNPATQRNIEILRKDGIEILWPDSGEQACGDYGIGRTQKTEDIFQHLENVFSRKHHLAGKKVLITAGPTQERIAAIRCITNRSSGKMGCILAVAAAHAGAEVTLILGPCVLPKPSAVHTIDVITTQEMLCAVQENIIGQDIFISAAAICDYTPFHATPEKLGKVDELTITFHKTIDVLATTAKNNQQVFCVGFCCETSELDKKAQKKRIEKNIPLIVGNLADDAIGQETNCVVLYDRHGKHVLEKNHKSIVAAYIIEHIHALMMEKSS